MTRIISYRFGRSLNGGKTHIVRRDGNTLCGKSLTIGKITRHKPAGRNACIRCAQKAHIIVQEEGSLTFDAALKEFTVPAWVIRLPDGFVCTRTTIKEIATTKFAKMCEQYGPEVKLEEHRATIGDSGVICLV